MALAAEEIPFVLQGPRPPVPPAFWESYWGLAVFGAALAVAAVLLARRFRRRGPAVVAPFAALETGLRLADGQPAPAAIAPDVLRHRLILTYEADAEGVDADAIVRRVLDAVVVP